MRDTMVDMCAGIAGVSTKWKPGLLLLCTPHPPRFFLYGLAVLPPEEDPLGAKVLRSWGRAPCCGFLPPDRICACQVGLAAGFFWMALMRAANGSVDGWCWDWRASQCQLIASTTTCQVIAGSCCWSTCPIIIGCHLLGNTLRSKRHLVRSGRVCLAPS